LSGGIHLKTQNSKSYLQRLLSALGQSLDTLKEGDLVLDHATLTVRRLDQITVLGEAAKPEADNPLTRIDPVHFAKVWKERARAAQKAREMPLVVTPTSVVSDTWYVVSDTAEPASSSPTTYHLPRTTTVQIGTLVHKFLESWDFSCEKCSMPAKLRQVANSYFAGLGMLEQPLPDPKLGSPKYASTHNMFKIIDIVEESQSILADFIGSEAWEEIKGAEILGKEVPFFYQTPATRNAQRVTRNTGKESNDALRDTHCAVPTLMRGTMDLLYRLPSGLLVIGDYKTDKDLDPSKYAEQGKAYEEAVTRALGEKATFKLIHLREGSAVSL
jgi:hypothetical protein